MVICYVRLMVVEKQALLAPLLIPYSISQKTEILALEKY